MAYFDRCNREISPEVWVDLTSDNAYRFVRKTDLGRWAIITLWRGMDPYRVHLDATERVQIFEVMQFELRPGTNIRLRLAGDDDQREWYPLDEQRFDAYTEKEATDYHTRAELTYRASQQ